MQFGYPHVIIYLYEFCNKRQSLQSLILRYIPAIAVAIICDFSKSGVHLDKICMMQGIIPP